MDPPVLEQSKKNGRPKGRNGVRTQFYLPYKVMKQIEDLSEVLHVSRGAVICQAVARLHGQEPLLRGGGRARSREEED
jgi:hypothetical protein